jgi:hypothetical protein
MGKLLSRLRERNRKAYKLVFVPCHFSFIRIFDIFLSVKDACRIIF